MAEVINESTFNFNTPEAKITKEVSQQFVASHTGKIMKQSSLRKETRILLARVADMEQKQQSEFLRNLVNSTNLTEENGLKTFLRVSELLFDNQVNWGRILALYLYAALLLEKLKKNGNDSFSDKIALWLSICVSRQSAWICDVGNGWVRTWKIFFFFLLIFYLFDGYLVLKVKAFLNLLNSMAFIQGVNRAALKTKIPLYLRFSISSTLLTFF